MSATRHTAWLRDAILGPVQQRRALTEYGFTTCRKRLGVRLSLRIARFPERWHVRARNVLLPQPTASLISSVRRGFSWTVSRQWCAAARVLSQQQRSLN